MEFTLGTTKIIIPTLSKQNVVLHVFEQKGFLDLLQQVAEKKYFTTVGFNDKIKNGGIFNIQYNDDFRSCNIQLSPSCDFEFSYDGIIECIDLEQLLALKCKIKNTILKVMCHYTVESKWWNSLLGYLKWESPLRQLQWKKFRYSIEKMMRNAIDYFKLICLALCQQEGEWYSFCCIGLYHPQLLCLIWDFCYDRSNFSH